MGKIALVKALIGFEMQFNASEGLFCPFQCTWLKRSLEPAERVGHRNFKKLRAMNLAALIVAAVEFGGFGIKAPTHGLAASIEGAKDGLDGFSFKRAGDCARLDNF